MTRTVLCWMIYLLIDAGCAGRLQDSANSGAAPELTVVVLHKDMATGALRPLGVTELLSASEEATLEMQVNRLAYVSVVLYAAAGASEELVESAAAAPQLAGRPLRVTVPRRAPPGVQEAELRIFLIASATPIAPAVRQLLRLPCDSNGGRGDPEPKKGKDDAKEKKKEGGDSSASKGESGKPREGGPRGGDAAAVACASPAGLTSPVTLRALVLRSQ